MFRVTQDTATPTLASHTGLSPSMMHLSRCFRSQLPYDSAVLQPQRCVATTLVWALPRSLATTRGIISLFSLPAGTKMFQFPAFASLLNVRMTGLQPDGLSHSEIFGSKVICTFPKLIAAYHVLHRLREPRHPPCALRYFLAVQQHLRAAVAHTFSCILVLNLIAKIKDRNLSLRFYSLACVNMSKIF